MVMSDSIIPLEDVTLTGVEDHPPNSSVKLHGPPGTGKTTQSAARVGRLIQNEGYSVGDVAWCTYRKSLAADTLDKFVGWDLLDESQLRKPHEGVTRFIATTHAVANRTVGDLPDPVEEWQRNDFADRIGLQYWSKQSWDETPGKQLFRVFDWMNMNCLDPAKPEDVYKVPFIDELKEEWGGDVSNTWNKWEDYKAQRDIIDFHEMLEAPISAGAYPTSDILVIDEYHDATPLMAKLSEFWIDQADIVIVAGDPNQVVNSFDGADPRFFEELDLPKVLLDKTYRVPEEHWTAATKLLSKAHSPPPVERVSHGQLKEYKSPPFRYESSTNDWDVPSGGRPGSPGKIVDEHGTNTLFLTRMRMQADGVGAALEKAGVPYYSQEDLYGWNTDKGAERLYLHNGLQKIEGFQAGHFGSGSGLGQFANEPPASPDTVELSHEEAIRLLSYSHAKYLDGRRAEIDAICDELERDEQPVTLSKFSEWVEPEFWHNFTNGAASVSRLNKGDLSDRGRIALVEALKQQNGPVNPEDLDVGVLTIHASKGQEAQDVVVYDGVSTRIWRSMSRSEAEEANEWRTWYVALTRASKRLHIMRGGFDWTTSILPDNILQMIAGGGE